MKERQELWCHECQRYVQFDIDMSLNGNHVIKCPVCGHEHCRVVENGKITEVRWDNRNKNNWSGNGNVNSFNTYLISTGITTSAASTFNTYTAATRINGGTTSASSIFTYGAWLNTTGAC